MWSQHDISNTDFLNRVHVSQNRNDSDWLVGGDSWVNSFYTDTRLIMLSFFFGVPLTKLIKTTKINHSNLLSRIQRFFSERTFTFSSGWTPEKLFLKVGVYGCLSLHTGTRKDPKRSIAAMKQLLQIQLGGFKSTPLCPLDIALHSYPHVSPATPLILSCDSCSSGQTGLLYFFLHNSKLGIKTETSFKEAY